MEKQPQHNETTTTQEINNETGFLFKKLKGIVTPTLTEYWLSVPEFLNEIMQARSEDKVIDIQSVFDIMRSIYFRKLKDKNSGISVDFKFSQARRCLRVLSEYLTGNRDNWDL